MAIWLDSRSGSRWATVRAMDETRQICPWCSTPVTPGAATCAKCGAVVEGAIAPEIPGVTVVDGKAALGSGEGMLPDDMDPVSWLRAGGDEGPVNHEAILPPSDAVRYEMRRLELEAQLANAGGSVMSAAGDEPQEVGKPSQEALEALKAGLIEMPEAELAERADALEWEQKD